MGDLFLFNTNLNGKKRNKIYSSGNFSLFVFGEVLLIFHSMFLSVFSHLLLSGFLFFSFFLLLNDFLLICSMRNDDL